MLGSFDFEWQLFELFEVVKIFLLEPFCSNFYLWLKHKNFWSVKYQGKILSTLFLVFNVQSEHGHENKALRKHTVVSLEPKNI